MVSAVAAAATGNPDAKRIHGRESKRDGLPVKMEANAALMTLILNSRAGAEAIANR
jgi:hypothetical protein